MSIEQVTEGLNQQRIALKEQLHLLGLPQEQVTNKENAIDHLPEPVLGLIAPPSQDFMTEEARKEAANYLFHTLEDFQFFRYAIQDGPKAYVVYAGAGFAQPRQQMLANAIAHGYLYTQYGGEWQISIPKSTMPAEVM